jgi:uncharacterized radical SAM superfamily Fe-S cluster-containing enzyme
VAEYKQRLEVYLQFDGFRESTSRALRGVPLTEIKLRAIEQLGAAGIRVILVTTLQPGVNEDEIGDIVKFGLQRPWITGVSFQPATYSGRNVLPQDLEQRITFPDVVNAVAQQTDGLFRTDDFMPLPCAHPNCHSLTYAYRNGDTVVPLNRFIDTQSNLDLLANGITFTRPRARQLIERYLGRLGCCSGADCSSNDGNGAPKQRTAIELPVLSGSQGQPIDPGNVTAQAQEFFSRALAEDLGPSDVFRITITSFLDAYNFDLRRLMKCCIHHVLPSGHVIPFCAYNVLYRDGHVKLPQLQVGRHALAGRAT